MRYRQRQEAPPHPVDDPDECCAPTRHISANEAKPNPRAIRSSPSRIPAGKRSTSLHSSGSGGAVVGGAPGVGGGTGAGTGGTFGGGAAGAATADGGGDVAGGVVDDGAATVVGTVVVGTERGGP